MSSRLWCLMLTALGAWSCATPAPCVDAPSTEASRRENAMTGQTPRWLTDVLASTRLGGIDPALVDAAAADAGYARAIESVIVPGQRQESFNLRYLLYELDVRDRRPEHLALARRMHEVDPEHHGQTLVWIAGQRPLEQCEAEVLVMAFDPRGPEESDGWRSGRESAASSLVQRLAFDARVLPRPLPAGAPTMRAAKEDRFVACYQYALLAAYGQGDPGEAMKAVDECLARDETRPVNDHDAANCETVVYRLRDGR